MQSPHQQHYIQPSATDMKRVFSLCRDDRWKEILQRLEDNPMIALTPMVMVNHISSTVLHQAITSRGDLVARERVIRHVLRVTPQATSMRNGYGSLPLHVIAQRNTKIAARVKEQLIDLLVQANPQALLEPGGVGRRTPLHIIFTDYVSPRLTQVLIDHGAAACAMKDKKGWLPAHVAASRHCSPEKLQMLLNVYPEALHETTEERYTLLSLAKSTATPSHPNFALIRMLERETAGSALSLPISSNASSGHVSPPPGIGAAVSPDMSPVPFSMYPSASSLAFSSFGLPEGYSFVEEYGSSANREYPYPEPLVAHRKKRGPKRGHDQLYDDPVGLLLHLSHSGKDGGEEDQKMESVKRVEV